MKRFSNTNSSRRSTSLLPIVGVLAVFIFILAVVRRPHPQTSIKQAAPQTTPCTYANDSGSTKSPDKPGQLSDIKLSDEDERFFRRKSMINYPKIFMDRVEVDFVVRHLDGRKTYLEYGSGGSTLNFIQFVDSAVSVEHDKAWCEKLKELMSNEPWRNKLDYRCSFVENGNSNEGNYVRFKHVVDQIDQAAHQLYDFVLVDGRARVDCAIKVLSYITPNSAVVVHDAHRFKDNNFEYEPMLKYYDTVESIVGSRMRGIALLKRKKEYDYLQGNHSAVQQILNTKYSLS